jgi:hypothetical protein
MQDEPPQRSFLQKFFGTNLPNPGKWDDVTEGSEAARMFMLNTFEGVK